MRRSHRTSEASTLRQLGARKETRELYNYLLYTAGDKKDIHVFIRRCRRAEVMYRPANRLLCHLTVWGWTIRPNHYANNGRGVTRLDTSGSGGHVFTCTTHIGAPVIVPQVLTRLFSRRARAQQAQDGAVQAVAQGRDPDIRRGDLARAECSAQQGSVRAFSHPPLGTASGGLGASLAQGARREPCNYDGWGGQRSVGDTLDAAPSRMIPVCWAWGDVCTAPGPPTLIQAEVESTTFKAIRPRDSQNTKTFSDAYATSPDRSSTQGPCFECFWWL